MLKIWVIFITSDVVVFEKEQIDPQCGLGLSPVGQLVFMKLKIRMASLGISRHVRNITIAQVGLMIYTRQVPSDFGLKGSVTRSVWETWLSCIFIVGVL